MHLNAGATNYWLLINLPEISCTLCQLFLTSNQICSGQHSKPENRICRQPKTSFWFCRTPGYLVLVSVKTGLQSICVTSLFVLFWFSNCLLQPRYPFVRVKKIYGPNIESHFHSIMVHQTIFRWVCQLCLEWDKAGRHGSGRPTTWIEMRGATSWVTYGTSFYILTTGTGSQSWWRLPTWSRNVDKQYVIFGCIKIINITLIFYTATNTVTDLVNIQLVGNRQQDVMFPF